VGKILYIVLKNDPEFRQMKGSEEIL